MRGPRLGVKWAPGGASASPNFPATTATSAPMVTFTTLSASVSYIWSYHTDCTHLFLAGLILVFMDAWCRDKITSLSSAGVLTKQSDTKLLQVSEQECT